MEFDGCGITEWAIEKGETMKCKCERCFAECELVGRNEIEPTVCPFVGDIEAKWVVIAADKDHWTAMNFEDYSEGCPGNKHVLLKGSPACGASQFNGVINYCCEEHCIGYYFVKQIRKESPKHE